MCCAHCLLVPSEHGRDKKQYNEDFAKSAHLDRICRLKKYIITHLETLACQILARKERHAQPYADDGPRTFALETQSLEHGMT